MLRSVAGILLTVGHLAFATLFVMNLAGWGQQRTGGPTYFAEPAEGTPAVTAGLASRERCRRGSELAHPFPS